MYDIRPARFRAICTKTFGSAREVLESLFDLIVEPY